MLLKISTKLMGTLRIAEKNFYLECWEKKTSKIAIHSDVKMGITIYGLQFRTIIFTELTKCNGKERITGFSSGTKNP
jgi:hypothetical protein